MAKIGQLKIQVTSKGEILTPKRQPGRTKSRGIRDKKHHPAATGHLKMFDRFLKQDSV